MKPTRQWMLYSLLRVGIFAAALILLLLTGLPPWVAAIIAAVVGTCITYLFFGKQREAVAASLYEYRNSRHPDVDGDAENEALDAAQSPSAQRLPPPVAASERESGAETEAEDQRRQTGEL